MIDKSVENLWQRAEEISPSGYDAVFDANGVATLTESYNHLAPGGKLVVYGMNKRKNTCMLHNNLLCSGIF